MMPDHLVDNFGISDIKNFNPCLLTFGKPTVNGHIYNQQDIRFVPLKVDIITNVEDLYPVIKIKPENIAGTALLEMGDKGIIIKGITLYATTAGSASNHLIDASREVNGSLQFTVVGHGRIERDLTVKEFELVAIYAFPDRRRERRKN
jgi:hypothetical protein